MANDMSPDTRPWAKVGLMADPGLPLSLATKLAPALPEFFAGGIDNAVRWRVEVEEYSLPLDGDGAVRLTDSSSRLRARRGWDYMVYVTDLPKYILNAPLVATLNTTYGAGMIIVPALGPGGMRPLRRVLSKVVAALHGEDPGPYRRRALWPAKGRNLASGAGMAGKGPGDRVETARGVPGRLALLGGMVRSNTPLKLLPRLSSSMAAAIGTAAFGIFYTSIWSMADYLSPARMLLISLLSVTIMLVWLIGSHGLWEKPVGAHLRERRLLYNSATTATVGVAVAAMYIALFVVVLLGALVIINIDFLSEKLQHEAGLIDYVNLAWMSTSMGTIGGAVGSNMSNAEEARRAMFSNREYERRQLSLEQEDDAE